MANSRAPASTGRHAVNVMCVDVRDLFRTVASDAKHSHGRTTAVTMQEDTTNDIVSERHGRWVKGEARHNVALPPVSPADPVVIEEVLRDPMPTLTGARPTAATMHATRGAEFAAKPRRPRIIAAATATLMPSRCASHRGAEGAHQPIFPQGTTSAVDDKAPGVSRDASPAAKKASTPSAVTPSSTLLLSQPLSALATEVVDNVLSRLQQRAAHKADDLGNASAAPPHRPSAADTQAAVAMSDALPTAKPALVSSMHIAPPRATVQGTTPSSQHWGEYHSNELRRDKPRAFARLISEAHALPQQRYVWQREQMRRRRLNKPLRLQDSLMTSNLSSTMQSMQRSAQTPPMTNTLHGFMMPDGLTRVVPGPFRHRVVTEHSVPLTRRPKKC